MADNRPEGMRSIVYVCNSSVFDTRKKDATYGAMITQDVIGDSKCMPLKIKGDVTDPAVKQINNVWQYDQSTAKVASIYLWAEKVTPYQTNGNVAARSVAKITISIGSYKLAQKDSQVAQGTAMAWELDYKGTTAATSWLQTAKADLKKWFHVFVTGQGSSIKYWHFQKTMSLTINVTYKYNLDSINDIGDLIVSNPATDFGRKITLQWYRKGFKTGQKPFNDAHIITKVRYTVYDANKTDIPLDVKETTSTAASTTPYSTTTFPIKYGEKRTYNLKVESYDGTTLIETKELASTNRPQLTTPGPSMTAAPIFRLKPKNASDEDVQDQLSTGSILTDEKVDIQWTCPRFKHAEGLRVNFEILASTSNDMTNARVLKILFANKNECPAVATGSTSLTTEPADTAPEDDKYVYHYTISKTDLNNLGIGNYQRVYVAVRAVIKNAYNDTLSYYNSKTQTLSVANSELTNTLAQDMWEQFICVYECNVQYCPDGFKWVKCLMYYCPDGTEWKPVVARWSPDGTHWVYC